MPRLSLNREIRVSARKHLFKNVPDDDFIVQIATIVEDACKLAEVGFDKFTEINGVQIFRRRK